ncbi:hypothetical protein [Endozoicomonas sp. ALD040]|uniref:hypothetical protein n=1 Tax=unclassified Endozoicomonas TaxID=2644528 RepID=UPI003BAF413E
MVDQKKSRCVPKAGMSMQSREYPQAMAWDTALIPAPRNGAQLWNSDSTYEIRTCCLIDQAINGVGLSINF